MDSEIAAALHGDRHARSTYPVEQSIHLFGTRLCRQRWHLTVDLGPPLHRRLELAGQQRNYSVPVPVARLWIEISTHQSGSEEGGKREKRAQSARAYGWGCGDGKATHKPAILGENESLTMHDFFSDFGSSTRITSAPRPSSLNVRPTDTAYLHPTHTAPNTTRVR
jgi:hypothetical protein